MGRLNERDLKLAKGLMFTIDRSSQCMSHLLRLYGISQEGLLFLDAIASHSSVDTYPDMQIVSVGLGIDLGPQASTS